MYLSNYLRSTTLKGGGSHMRPRTNFVLPSHGECLHSNTYKNAFICFENYFRSQDGTLTYSTFVTIPALFFAYISALI